MKILKMKQHLIIPFVVLSSPLSFAWTPDTGSFGSFTAKVFLQNTTPWTVFRMEGSHSFSGFPCDSQGMSCSREKNYVISQVRPQVRQTTGIQTGVNEPLGEVNRVSRGTLRRIEIKSLNNLNLARIDETRSSSLLGIDGSQVATVSRAESLFDTSTIGFIESKGATWATLSPTSFYYQHGNEHQLGVSVLEKIRMMGMIQNFLTQSPGKESIRGGTLFCQSDKWVAEINSLVKNDEFNEQACKNTALLSSVTSRTFSENAAAWFLNRQDSQVHLPVINKSYKVEATTEWFCPFDCDGTTYQIKSIGHQSPDVLITSDRWSFQSSTQFKVKVFFVDWEHSGELTKIEQTGTYKDLNTLASNPAIAKYIAGILVSEVNDFRGVPYQNGQWTQKTYLILPPSIIGHEFIPQDFKQSEGKTTLFRMKVIDAILAMMPDQTQSSPELADLEEKLDETRLLFARHFYGSQFTPANISSDLMFDIYSEVDATTAPSRPASSELQASTPGKIEWFLGLLGE